MEVLHKGYWLGKSVTYIEKDLVRDLERHFHILDYGYDVSVLSVSPIYISAFFILKSPLLLYCILRLSFAKT
mgnify:CR=1 FL=1